MKYVRHPNGQIQALENIVNENGTTLVAKGGLGGYIDSVRNLSQTGSCWVFPGSAIMENAYVSGNAVVGSYAGCNSCVTGNARVYGNAQILGGNVRGNARVLGDAVVQKWACVAGDACVSGEATVIGYTTIVSEKAKIQGKAYAHNTIIHGRGVVMGKAVVSGTLITDGGYVSGCTDAEQTAVLDTARLIGCAAVQNARLEASAVVSRPVERDNIEDELVIEDSSFDDSCPPKDECCPADEEDAETAGKRNVYVLLQQRTTSSSWPAFKSTPYAELALLTRLPNITAVAKAMPATKSNVETVLRGELVKQLAVVKAEAAAEIAALEAEKSSMELQGLVLPPKEAARLQALTLINDTDPIKITGSGFDLAVHSNPELADAVMRHYGAYLNRFYDLTGFPVCF